MEPLAHTLLGANLGQLALPSNGEARRERGLVAAAVLAANVPDVDALAYVLGSDFALGFRRGITHGVVAMVAWPLLLVALFAAWRARRAGTAWRAQLTPRLVAVAALGCWSHPLLDWLNNYGIRLLAPFEQRWFYGDVAFIVDPWMWLLLGGGLVLARDDGARVTRRWLALAVICGVLVAVAPAPQWARAVWLAALAGVILAVRVRRSSRKGISERAETPETPEATASPPFSNRTPVSRSSASGAAPRSRVPVAVGLSLFTLYVGALAVVERGARARVVERLRAEGELAGTGAREPGARELMVGPLPMNPLAWQVVARAAEGYRVGVHRVGSGAVEWETQLTPQARGPQIEDAWSDPSVAGFARWVRFPYERVIEEPEGRFVYLLDARYTTRPTRGFGGARVPAPSPAD